MAHETKDMKELAERIAKINEANGWAINVNDPQELGLKVALIASEAVEVLDEMDKYWEAMLVSKREAKKKAVIEFADIAIRVIHLANALSIPIHERTVDFNLGSQWLDIDDGPMHLAGVVTRQIIQPCFKLFEIIRQPLLNRAEVAALLHIILENTFWLAAMMSAGESLFPVIDAKLDKNAQRGFKHGGKNF